MSNKKLNSEQNQDQSEQFKEISDFESRRYGIYILGAGFSRPAGLPLATELWSEVYRRGHAMTGRAGQFRDDLDTFIEYKKNCEGIKLTPDQVDFEEFIAFLDVEFHLGLRGKETWSSEGNETQVVVKTLIGEILTEWMPSKEEIPEIYLRFAEILKPNDYVLTFNYDVLLERALETAGVPFRLFSERYKVDPINPDRKLLFVDDSRDEVVVLKLHGSIDWFDRSLYRQLEEDRVRNGFPPGGRHTIFQRPQDLGVTKLVEGPRFPDDPLNEMYRVKDIEQLYSRGILFHATPSLLSPSPAKILYAEKLRDFWWGLGYAGVVNFSMAIIGFSLPSQDEYARQVIYRLVKNYQMRYWDDNVWRHKKTKLVLVDFRKTVEEEQAFRQRYAFVDWNRAVMHFDGFNEKALKLLQA